MPAFQQLAGNPFSQYLRGQYPQTPLASNIRHQLGLQPQGGFSGGFQLGTAGNQNFIPMPGPRYQHGMGSPESGPGQGLAQLQGPPRSLPSSIPRAELIGATPPFQPNPFQPGFQPGIGGGGGFQQPPWATGGPRSPLGPIGQGLGFGGFPGFQQQPSFGQPNYQRPGLFQPNFTPQPGLFGGNPFVNQFSSQQVLQNNPYLGQFNQTAGQYGALRPYQGPFTSPASVGIQGFGGGAGGYGSGTIQGGPFSGTQISVPPELRGLDPRLQFQPGYQPGQSSTGGGGTSNLYSEEERQAIANASAGVNF